MSIVLYMAIGLTTGAAVLHATLGLVRPRNPTYLLFAGIMVFLTLYLWFGLDLYRATTPDQAVEVLRNQAFAVLGCQACFLAFVPAYTRVRLPEVVMTIYWGGLAILFAINQWTPYGLWLSGPPELVRSTFRGEPYTAIVDPPMSIVQYGYDVYFATFLVVALACAVAPFRRGERRRSVTFAVAVIILLLLDAVDMIRDFRGEGWPFVAEPGFVAVALLMSVQLALDFRALPAALWSAIAHVTEQSGAMTSILAAMRALEQHMHVPLEILEIEATALSAATTSETEQLPRIRRAVERLRDLEITLVELDAHTTSKSPIMPAT